MTEIRLAPGLQIGEYVLESRLGAGGMGEVWRASQPIIETTVAIKILTFESSARKSQLERFLREARAVNRIQHRNLAKIFSFGELADGRPYFVMEFLAGDNLRDFLKKSGPLPFATIYHIAEQVCRTLLAAHEQGVIHRDLKPENIFLVTEPGSLPFVKVLDFGVAKLADKDPLAKREHPTQTGATLGTPGYMSPEQYENSKTVDERADIYSMAVIIFEMLCGQHPFEIAGETAYVVIARQLSSDPRRPSLVIPSRHVPKELDTFLLRALSRKPEERPRDCREFLESFQKALGDLRLEQELSTHTNEPTQLNASYDNLRAQKVLPPLPTPTAQMRVEEVLFSDESRTETKDSTYPAISIADKGDSTQITPPPISSRAKPDDDVTITGGRGSTPPNLPKVEVSGGLTPQRERPEVLRTTPDVEMPELIRDLLAKKPSEEDREITEAPTAAYQVVPVNTPAPISVPTTSPQLQSYPPRVLVGAGVGVFLLVLFAWLLFNNNNTPERQRAVPGTTLAAPLSTSAPAPVTAPTVTPQSKPNKEPLPAKEEPKKPDLCKKDREEAKGLMASTKWAQALVILARAQEKCPRDPEVQRLFGYTYEQKGDIGFACIRYNTALSFGLSGVAAARTKKTINELKCQ